MTYVAQRQPRHETVSVRGLRHHLTRWGPDSVSPLVLLHGWMDTGETFQFVVDQLPTAAAVVAPDWRGFGQSEWQADGYWFPDYLADLDALLEVITPGQPARIAGHSMGGNIASLYAGTRPERVARIVNMEGLGLPRTQPGDAPARYAKWLAQLRVAPTFSQYASFGEFAASLCARNPRLPRERAEFVVRSWAKQNADGQVVIRADPRHKLVNPTLYRREEAEACWRNITAPVLLLVGGDSDHLARLGLDGAEAHFRAQFAQLSIERVAGAGHMMHHEQPEQVARHIAAFLLN